MKLHFLCYSSVRRGNHESLLDEIRSILDVARKFNKQHNITGVLYYSQGRFFQYIEGLESVIESLFDQIVMDPRHHLIHYHGTYTTDYRRFKEWSMKYVQKDSKVDLFFKQKGETTLMSLALNENNLFEFLDCLTLADQDKAF